MKKEKYIFSVFLLNAIYINAASGILDRLTIEASLRRRRSPVDVTVRAETQQLTPQEKQFGRLLLKRPEDALREIERVGEQFYKELRECSGCDKEVDSLIKKFSRKNPVFVLGECTGSGMLLPCSLSRKRDPTRRIAFESCVVTLCRDGLRSEQSLDCVSFGSGDMYQDLVILAKVFENHPQARIALHMIDAGYESIWKSGARKIDVSSPIPPFTDVIAFFKEKSDTAAKLLSDQELELLCSRSIFAEMRARQLKQLLLRMYPKARLDIYMHPSVSAYGDYLQQQNMKHPRVIYGADIQTMMDLAGETALMNYLSLCKSAPDASNVLLAKNHPTSDAYLISVTNEQASRAISIKVPVVEAGRQVLEDVFVIVKDMNGKNVHE